MVQEGFQLVEVLKLIRMDGVNLDWLVEVNKSFGVGGIYHVLNRRPHREEKIVHHVRRHVSMQIFSVC